MEDLGLRISNEYPFMSLSLIVDQEVSSTHEKRRDTLACDLISGQGVVKGCEPISVFVSLDHNGAAKWR